MTVWPVLGPQKVPKRRGFRFWMSTELGRYDATMAKRCPANQIWRNPVLWFGHAPELIRH
jgi:hypothetical protein